MCHRITSGVVLPSVLAYERRGGELDAGTTSTHGYAVGDDAGTRSVVREKSSQAAQGDDDSYSDITMPVIKKARFPRLSREIPPRGFPFHVFRRQG
jgi:hypothetical protein